MLRHRACMLMVRNADRMMESRTDGGVEVLETRVHVGDDAYGEYA